MRLKRHVSIFQSNLKRHVSARPLLSPQCLSHRRYCEQSSATYPENIAILGAGISGLSSAHFISKEFPKSKITVIDRQNETGGWIKSRKVEVEGGEVLLEYGPRTLRPGPSALPTLKLIDDLALGADVYATDNDSASARNRYIYYPDQLNALPSRLEDITLSRLLRLYSSGIINGAWNLATEGWTPRRGKSVMDESVGHFISRRVDERVANNIVSAVFHGIFAGDIYQLSARTLLPTPWRFEGMFGSAIRGLLTANSENTTTQALIPWTPFEWDQYQAMKGEISFNTSIVDGLSGKSTFTFQQGLQQLPRAMEKSLRRNKRIKFLLGTEVRDVRKIKGVPQIAVNTGDDELSDRTNYDFVVSTLPEKTLTPFVNVMVVNLWFKNPSLAPVKGFGYLIPSSVPFEQNPERALGVIFDHDATPNDDTVEGTKLTVMLGGHWWDDWVGLPDDAEGAELAKSVIKRHLGITAEPDLCHVNLHKNAIPQYTVGYEDRCREYDERLKMQYGGRLRVVSSQCNGVGVNDCIKGAWQLARDMRGNGWRARQTGLERYTDERQPIMKPSGTMKKTKE